MASTRTPARPGPARSRTRRDPEATRGTDPAAPQGPALYVYGIVRADPPLRCDEAGVDARWPVRTIRHGDLAAVVSGVDSGVVESTRDNLLAHERVNAAVLRGHTLVPMSFGTVFRSAEDVAALLRSAHDAFADVLDKVEDRVEFGVKVSWDRDATVAAIEREDEEVRELHEEIVRLQGAGFPERMRYGRLVEAALEHKAQACVDAFLRRLRPVCVASRSNPTVGERMILNAAFLVQRGEEPAFERRLQAIAKDFGDLAVQLTGPWPPYNFVAIRLKREGPGEPP